MWKKQRGEHSDIQQRTNQSLQRVALFRLEWDSNALFHPPEHNWILRNSAHVAGCRALKHIRQWLSVPFFCIYCVISPPAWLSMLAAAAQKEMGRGRGGSTSLSRRPCRQRTDNSCWCIATSRPFTGEISQRRMKEEWAIRDLQQLVWEGHAGRGDALHFHCFPPPPPLPPPTSLWSFCLCMSKDYTSASASAVVWVAHRVNLRVAA